MVASSDSVSGRGTDGRRGEISSRGGQRPHRVLELGADDFVDVDRDGWETTIGPVDLVYDAIGGDVLGIHRRSSSPVVSR
jgi:hypothetical protein